MSIHIINNVWIGTYDFLMENQNKEVLMDFDTIINLCSVTYSSNLCQIVNKPMGMPIPDHEEKFSLLIENLTNYINRLVEKEERILIVCRFGSQYAPLVLLQYLITHLYMSKNEAMKLIKEKCEKEKIYVNWNYTGFN